MFLFLTTFLTVPPGVRGGDKKQFIPDKELCAKMLRFGKQAYVRGKYLDAKAYFRKAVQADPSHQKAWQYYDMATIFALAEKVEKNADLILPDASTRKELTGAGSGTKKLSPPSPPPAAPAKKGKAKAVEEDDEEEGC
jgi:hypothetical protein